jgi:hypothetical protein
LLLALAIGTLVLAVTVGKLVGNAWADRYTAVAFVPFLLCLALGTERLGDRRIWAGAVALIALFGSLAAGPVVEKQRTQAVEVASALRTYAHPGDVVLYCPDQLGPAVMREIRAGRGGEGLKNFAIPTFTAPDRVDWVDYKQRNTAAEGNVQGLVNRALSEAGNHTIWLVYSNEYLTYQVLCPSLRLALTGPRQFSVVVGTNPESYEHEELDRYTVKPR